MHEAEPYGHLIVGGAAPSEREIARLVGASVSEVKSCLSELRNAGVFSTNSEGVIYSRRMVRDREKAQRDRVNGAAGGNPQLKMPGGFSYGARLSRNPADMNEAVNGLDNGRVNPADKPLDKAAGARPPTFQKPVSREQDAEGSNEPSAAPAALDSRKEVFDRGKAILGNRAGGLVAKLLQHCDGDCRRALSLLQLAASKGDPREYVGAVLRGDAAAKTVEILAETERLYRDLGVS
jgi:hypothetical protein